MNHPSSLLHPAFSLCCLALPCLFFCLGAAQAQNQIEQWGIFELALRGPTSANPWPAEYYLVYLGKQKPATWTFRLPKARLADAMKFRAEVLDTWNMIVTPVPGTFTIKKQDNYFYADEAGQSIPLPGRPYLAIRIKRVHG